MENQTPDGVKGNQAPSKLPARQAVAVPYFSGPGSFREKCERAGISPSSGYRYLANPAFRMAVEQAQKEASSEALQILKDSFSKAAQVMVSCLENGQVWVRLRSSERILETVMRLKDVEEVEARLETIERIVLEKRTYKQ